ncbi:MAG: glycoside hydrolase [Ferruginibacter sp.]|nr:glycoside hydrolase [Ferruginibacter sp.]
MKIKWLLTQSLFLAVLLPAFFVVNTIKSQSTPLPLVLTNNWKLQEISKVSQAGSVLSTAAFRPLGWYTATVPGTVLTSLVNNKVYPEPLYGENNRPDKIPESLCRTSYWYQSDFIVPQSYTGKQIWLNFDGINYGAKVWVNGKEVGEMRGAFSRGIFNISSLVTAGKKAAIAVLISPQPNPGTSHEHTIKNGMGLNGGLSAIDGATFLCSIGWDWIPAIRDRNTGIWQKVYLSATGPVQIKDPLVTSDVALPGFKSADVTIQATLQNVTGLSQKGILKGSFGDINFQMPVEIAANSSKTVSLNASGFPQLHINNPRLWWPNGYGPQNLYKLRLSFDVNKTVSDQHSLTFGIRKITYSVPDADNLTVSVNGVPVLCKGGNWGMDEAMKRNTYARLEAQIRMHQQANYTMIRNWVGQSTSEDFYDLCDKYGLMLWDEFFQPNPSDGPNPTDIGTYIANVREKILRFRNHPSIAIWCARNEGYPPKNIDDSLRKLMAELEPLRLYQPSSTEGKGVNSGGPYFWRTPREYYTFKEAFKTEIGSMSIPTLQSIHGMMPAKDWEQINDDWAEHDFAKGAQAGDKYPTIISSRFGEIANLADFVRKGQLANYEAYRAMYEGRNAKLFNPSTGVLTWMSNPAQPSFVWQLYHHDLEPNSSLFAARKACEPVHIQLNEKEGNIQVINNLPEPISGAHAKVILYNLDGSVNDQQDFNVSAPSFKATDLGKMQLPSTLTKVYFVKLKLMDAHNQLLSENFYWQGAATEPDNLQDLQKMPVANLEIKADRVDSAGRCFLNVTLHNPGSNVALMAHLQLRRANSKERVLPVYYTDNYISLVAGETRTIKIEVALADLKGQQPMVLVDGWNIKVSPSSAGKIKVALNTESQVESWPANGLHIQSSL